MGAMDSAVRAARIRETAWTWKDSSTPWRESFFQQGGNKDVYIGAEGGT